MEIKICETVTSKELDQISRVGIECGHAFYAKMGARMDLRIMVRSKGQSYECIYPLQARGTEFASYRYSYAIDQDRTCKDYQKVRLLAKPISHAN